MTIDLAPFIQKGQPKYRAIANALAEAIETMPLPAGTKLPPHRELAEQLNTSVQTISAAYAHAIQLGVVCARVGSGTFVSDNSDAKEVKFLDTHEAEDSKRGIDLSIAHAVNSPEHVDIIRNIMLKMSKSATGELIQACRPIAGLPRHREVACEWLRSQKMPCEPDQIALCNGATHGIMLALSTIVQPGDVVLCENLADHGLITLARTLHFRLVGLPMDNNGIIPGALDEACKDKKIAALCCTPTMNNPTTDTMDMERRRAIAAIAEKHQLLIVEDDVFGALLPDRLPPLSSLLPEQSFYVTSLTKTVAAGLRAGYLVIPKHLIHHTLPRLRATTWMATPILFEMASMIIENGTADRLIDWQRQELASRQRMAAEVLKGLNFKAHPYGMHIWLELPEIWRPDEVILQARQEGILIAPAGPYTVGHESPPHCIRITLGAEEDRARVHQGLVKLVAMLKRSPPPMDFVI